MICVVISSVKDKLLMWKFHQSLGVWAADFMLSYVCGPLQDLEEEAQGSHGWLPGIIGIHYQVPQFMS